MTFYISTFSGLLHRLPSGTRTVINQWRWRGGFWSLLCWDPFSFLNFQDIYIKFLHLEDRNFKYISKFLSSTIIVWHSLNIHQTDIFFFLVSFQKWHKILYIKVKWKRTGRLYDHRIIETFWIPDEAERGREKRLFSTWALFWALFSSHSIQSCGQPLDIRWLPQPSM